MIVFLPIGPLPHNLLHYGVFDVILTLQSDRFEFASLYCIFLSTLPKLDGLDPLVRTPSYGRLPSSEVRLLAKQGA